MYYDLLFSNRTLQIKSLTTFRKTNNEKIGSQIIYKFQNT